MDMVEFYQLKSMHTIELCHRGADAFDIRVCRADGVEINYQVVIGSKDEEHLEDEEDVENEPYSWMIKVTRGFAGETNPLVSSLYWYKFGLLHFINFNDICIHLISDFGVTDSCESCSWGAKRKSRDCLFEGSIRTDI